MSLAQNMLINFLKGLGINEALIMSKMDEFAGIVRQYSDRMNAVDRKLDVLEQNVSIIMEKLEIKRESEKPAVDVLIKLPDKRSA